MNSYPIAVITMRANIQQAEDLKVEVRWTKTEITPAMKRLFSLLLSPRKDYEQKSDENGEQAIKRESNRPNH